MLIYAAGFANLERKTIKLNMRFADLVMGDGVDNTATVRVAML